MKIASIVTLSAAALLLSPVMAATVTVSSSVPTVDGADIANLLGGNDPGGDIGHLWNNRPHQGQSFTTGSNVGGYQLNSVTLRSRTTSTGSQFNVVVGSLSGSTLTQIGTTEFATPPAYSNNDYITFTFDTPLTLAATTTYGFIWGSAGPGFITDNNTTDPVYTGGTALSSGDNNVPDLNNILDRGRDRVFHVDLVAIPEPGTTLLGLLGGCFLLRRRRRA